MKKLIMNLKSLRSLLILSSGLALLFFSLNVAQKNTPEITLEKKSLLSNSLLLTADRDGIPALYELLAKTVPAHQLENLTHASDKLKVLVELTQNKQPIGWIRDTQLRSDATPYHNHRKDELLPIITQLGFVDEVRPSHMEYDYALVAGSTAQNVRQRLAYLGKLYTTGIRFKELIFLTGYRPLYESETAEVLMGHNQTDLPLRATWKPNTDMPTNEIEMIPWVFEQSQLFNTFEGIPTTYIAAQALPGKPRARTDETINAWKETNPRPGSCLLISDQPFINYQHTIFEVLAGQDFKVETVGQAAGNDTTIEVYLDALARALWAINQNSK